MTCTFSQVSTSLWTATRPVEALVSVSSMGNSAPANASGSRSEDRSSPNTGTSVSAKATSLSGNQPNSASRLSTFWLVRPLQEPFHHLEALATCIVEHIKQASFMSKGWWWCFQRKLMKPILSFKKNYFLIIQNANIYFLKLIN